MTKSKTDIYVLADRSGSMKDRKSAAIKGFNDFVDEQREVEGECHLSLTIFDHEFESLFERVDIKRVKPLTDKVYIPRGGTALLDSWMRGMATFQETLNKLSEEEKPDHVIFVVLTDGQENRSTEFYNRPEAVQEEVARLEKEEGWHFVYLGENQDAIEVGGSLGVGGASSLTYNGSKGIRRAYRATGTMVSDIRQKGCTRGFSEKDRDDSVN